jgi:predicted 3-demethylubiquinone-9 3-methyltransferase (glyoxalase superfamily)
MANLPKITPHLWFEKEGKEAAAFYCSLFPDSKLTHVSTIRGTPSGDCDIVSFELAGQPFKGISAGPLFKFNPSVSFMVNFDPAKDNNARNHLDATWEKLSQGGTALMPLGEYPFSARYGWIQDRYGLSWQLILSRPERPEQPFIIPSLMFTGAVAGRAEEAFDFYISIFEGSKIGSVHRYQAGQEPDKAGTVMFADFTLAGTWFAAMDSAHDHRFAFNEAVCF